MLDIDEARQLTGLNLVSARDALSIDGRSYHDMEKESESESHRVARGEAIGVFRSLGYHVYPEGIGIAGIFTLADFLAFRDGRIVFVEVLTDSNIRDEVVGRKLMLQQSAEICFVVFTGNKISDEPSLRQAKKRIEQRADVLYCQINGWSGNHIRRCYNMTVTYDTTRTLGIRASLVKEKAGRKKQRWTLQVRTKHYLNAINTPLSYPIFSQAYCVQQIIHVIFVSMASKLGGKFSRKGDRLVASRRKSGLKMLSVEGAEIARLHCVYLGSADDLVNPADILGVFEFNDPGGKTSEALVQAIESFPLTLEEAHQ